MADKGAWVVASMSVQLGRDLVAHDDLQPALQTVVDVAPEIASADAASITVLDHGRYRTAATTDPSVVEADSLQYALGEGPCVDATDENEHYLISDVANDPRWPRWGPRAAGLGVGSVLAVHVRVGDTSIGAINLYSHAGRDYGLEDISVGYMLASQVGAALAAVTKIENLTVGMDRRTIIGQAQGIIMQKYDLDAGVAWNTMVRLSQDSNIKVRLLAEEIVSKRALPEHRGPSS